MFIEIDFTVVAASRGKESFNNISKLRDYQMCFEPIEIATFTCDSAASVLPVIPPCVGNKKQRTFLPVVCIVGLLCFSEFILSRIP